MMARFFNSPYKVMVHRACFFKVPCILQQRLPISSKMPYLLHPKNALQSSSEFIRFKLSQYKRQILSHWVLFSYCPISIRTQMCMDLKLCDCLSEFELFGIKIIFKTWKLFNPCIFLPI